MEIRKWCYSALGVAAHIAFCPVGIPSVALFYGLKGKSHKSCCPMHDVLVFEMIYFWPLVLLLTPFGISSVIRETRKENKKKKRENEIIHKKQEILPKIQEYHKRVGFQTDWKCDRNYDYRHTRFLSRQ